MPIKKFHINFIYRGTEYPAAIEYHTTKQSDVWPDVKAFFKKGKYPKTIDFFIQSGTPMGLTSYPRDPEDHAMARVLAAEILKVLNEPQP